MADQADGSNLVRNIAIAAAVVTCGLVGFFAWLNGRHDKWEVDSLESVLSQLHEADNIKATDGFAAWTIYDRVLSEAAEHKISDDWLRQQLAAAARERDRLQPIADAVHREREAAAQKQAEQQRKAEAARQRIGEEEQRRRDEEERQRNAEASLLALARERSRLYAEPPQSALDVLKELRRAQTRIELGVTHPQYREVIADPVADATGFLKSADGKRLSELSGAFAAAISDYTEAAERWAKSDEEKKRIEAKFDGALDGSLAAYFVASEDELCRIDLRSDWASASVEITRAERLLDPGTCESALADRYRSRAARKPAATQSLGTASPSTDGRDSPPTPSNK